MGLYGSILTIVVLVGVAVFILLFEKKRATRIERDLGEMADRQRKPHQPRDPHGPR